MWTVDSTAVHTDSTFVTTDGFIPGAALAAAANDAIVANAALINWASVILTAPLYTGVGGIFDPNLVWPYTTPIVGSKISYDPTFITVLANGEINSTSNSCTAEIQFFDGTNVNEVDLTITPFMVGYASDTSSASGFMGQAAALAGAASTLTSALAALTTGIPLAGAASDLASAAGALNTAIQLAGASADSSSATGTLTSTSAPLAGAGTDTTTAVASLTTLIALAGAAADVLTATGALTTQIILAGQAGDITLAAGSLTTGVTVSGSATDTTTAAGLLGSLQPLFGAANDVTTAAGSLLTQITLQASALSATLGAGNLSTAIQLSGAATDALSATGALGVLALNTRPSRLITTTFYSNQLLGTAGPLPYAEYFSRAGDVEIYAIDWDGWLSNFWERGGIVPPGFVIRPTTPNGFSFVTVLGGQSGNAEPQWPSLLGQTVNDGSVIWASQAVDTTSLFATVQSATWLPPSGIIVSGAEVSGQVVIAEIDATAAVAGTNYAINVATKMSDGETKVGQIVLKVR